MQTVTGWVRRFIVLGMLTPAAIGGPYTASGTIIQNFTDAGDPGVGSGSSGPAGATWDHSFDNGLGLSALNSAFAGDGTLKTLAVVHMDWLGWASGNLSATARASLREVLLPDWAAAAEHANDPSATQLILRFAVDVTGSAGATSDSGPAASASIDYSATVGDASASGTQSVTANGPSSTSGTWGVVFLEATVPWQSSLFLDLSASASAGAGKTYLSFPVASAIGDFSHTLKWLGVQQIYAANSQGVRRELAGANIPIIGQETGFNYFNAAPSDAEMPEPSSMILLGAGLFGLWWRRRR